jgi:hypothetical protein
MEDGGRRGIRTPDQLCVRQLRYRCAIRPNEQGVYHYSFQMIQATGKFAGKPKKNGW